MLSVGRSPEKIRFCEDESQVRISGVVFFTVRYLDFSKCVRSVSLIGSVLFLDAFVFVIEAVIGASACVSR